MTNKDVQTLYDNIDLESERNLGSYVLVSKDFKEDITRVSKAAYLLDDVWIPFSLSRFDENDQLWITDWFYAKNF